MPGKINFASFVQYEIDHINDRAAWTDDQAAMFTLLLAGRYNDAGIMRELSISDAKYYRIKKEIRQKIAKVMEEKR